MFQQAQHKPFGVTCVRVRLYPQESVFVLDGQKGRAVFEVAHRKPQTKIFWHLDNQFIGETQRFHRHEIVSTAGKHQLTLIDQNGEKLTFGFEVIGGRIEKLCFIGLSLNFQGFENLESLNN